MTLAIAEAEQLFTISQAARQLHLHPNTIRKAERAGRIPGIRRERVSGHRYFTLDDIERLRCYFAAP